MPAPFQSQSPVKSIQGNASPRAKEKCLRQLHVVTGVDALSPNQRFGHSVATKLRLVSVDTGRNAEEPTRLETKVVCEIKVEAGRYKLVSLLTSIDPLTCGAIVHIRHGCKVFEFRIKEDNLKCLT